MIDFSRRESMYTTWSCRQKEEGEQRESLSRQKVPLFESEQFDWRTNGKRGLEATRNEGRDQDCKIAFCVIDWQGNSVELVHAYPLAREYCSISNRRQNRKMGDFFKEMGWLFLQVDHLQNIIYRRNIESSLKQASSTMDLGRESCNCPCFATAPAQNLALLNTCWKKILVYLGLREAKTLQMTRRVQRKVLSAKESTKKSYCSTWFILVRLPFSWLAVHSRRTTFGDTTSRREPCICCNQHFSR